MIARHAKIVDVSCVERSGGVSYYVRTTASGMDGTVVVSLEEYDWARKALLRGAPIVLSIGEGQGAP